MECVYDTISSQQGCGNCFIYRYRSMQRPGAKSFIESYHKWNWWWHLRETFDIYNSRCDLSSWFAQIQFYTVQFDLIQLNAVHHRTLFSPLSQSIMMSYINSISFDEYRLNFIISQITCPDKQSVNPHSSTSHSDTVSVEGLFSPMPSPSLDISRFR